MEQKENHKKPDEVMKDALETMNEAQGDRGLSEWFGAIFFYFVYRRIEPFEYFMQKKYESRNVWTGYFLKLILVGFGIFLIWYFLELNW